MSQLNGTSEKVQQEQKAASKSANYHLDHLRELESESIFVLREVAAKFENPVLMFSGGKDSILLTHLAMKAFYPARIPFPLLHVDTDTISMKRSLSAMLWSNV